MRDHPTADTPAPCNPMGPGRRQSGMRVTVLAGLVAVVLTGCASATPVPGGRSGTTSTVAPTTSAPNGPSLPDLTTPGPTTAPGTESDMLEPPSRPGPVTGSSGLFATLPSRTPSAPMTLTGTPEAGVEAGCLLLSGYLLIGGDRDVLTGGRPVTVTGRPDPDLRSTCQQGIPFQVESAAPGAGGSAGG